MPPTATQVRAQRMSRHGLSAPVASQSDYVELFRLLQPISPIAYSMPGSAPRLLHRTTFDDGVVADRLRADRRMVKGRYMGGSIAYVLADELALYGTAFCRPIAEMNQIQDEVYAVVEALGPLTPRQVKEETGYLNKRIMPALHRLQQAFLVYEDQVDEDWERGWYAFDSEWPDVEIDPERQVEALSEVLRRFLQANVHATWQQIRDWSGLPVRTLKATLAEMEARGDLVAADVEGLGEGWMLAERSASAEKAELDDGAPPRQVLMMHRSDPLTRAHSSELKGRYKGLEVLQYLLVDGEFRGAVCGHWRIGPHDVDDIVVELPAAERAARRDEVLAAVGWRYHEPNHRILRYDGNGIS